MTHAKPRDTRKKKAQRRALPAAIERYTPRAEDDCFMPCPAITIHVDLRDRFVCQLCRSSQMDIFTRPERADEETFHIMPCGHFAGQRCLERWWSSEAEMGSGQRSCPFCRLALHHPVCGHKVHARPLRWKDTGLLPRTLPEGGRIADRCLSCTEKELEDRLWDLKGRFREVKARQSSVADVKEFLTLKTALEDTLRALQSIRNQATTGFQEFVW